LSISQIALCRFEAKRGVRLIAQQVGMITKRKEEGCTLIHGRHNPDAAAMARNNAGDRGQTDAGTFKFR